MTQLQLLPEPWAPMPVAPAHDFTYSAKEYKVVCLREVPLEEPPLADNPQACRDYWHRVMPGHPYFDPEKECFVALLLNTRKRIKAHAYIALGTLDTVWVHQREVFRPAITAAASAIVLMHHHARPDSRCGQLLKIDVLDHVVIGRVSSARAKDYVSLRELGYFSF